MMRLATVLRHSLTLALLGGCLCAGLVQAAASGLQSHAHIDVGLVAESAQAVPGTPLTVALRLLPETGWHTYWRNPGDSGMETRIRWSLPEGVTAGAIQWPTPQRLPVAHLVNYGFEGETWLLTDLHLPADLPTDQPLRIAAQASWLVCKIECIPGSAELTLTLPVSAQQVRADPDQAAAFAAARARQPVPVGWPTQFRSAAGRLEVRIALPADALNAGTDAYLFPDNPELIDHSRPQQVSREAGGLHVIHPHGPLYRAAPAQFGAVLRLEGPAGPRGYALTAMPLAAVAAAAPAPSLNLLPVLGFALLGGLLLNLMPCVFPVLSLKALSLAQSAGHRRREQALHGLSYTAGVLASFALVAAILLALRAGGAAVGWGFQLQSPLFVGALAFVMFALALSLSGVIEFGTRWMGIGERLAATAGYRGSFFTGVLATVVASPCTAPFMGAALGFAVVQPPAMALAVFLTLGVGMAMPFLLLGLLPGLGKRLPRPGAWMETFKQAMAFPLYLTVVWLLWVLGRQTGVDAMAAAALGLVAVALALWWWGRPAGCRPLLRRLGVLALLALAAASLRVPMLSVSAPPAAARAGADHEAFSAARLAELRGAGRVVFVNMTADWCITCLVNEQVALNTASVRRAFAAHDVAYLKGDWTRHDPAITDYLAGYGRNGVPHYVVYLPGQDGRVLPQILTAGLVVDALQR